MEMMAAIKLGTRVSTIDDIEHVGTVVMTVSSKALVRWHKGYRTWHLMADLVVAQDQGEKV
jgi:hypothetical protein